MDLNSSVRLDSSQGTWFQEHDSKLHNTFKTDRHSSIHYTCLPVGRKQHNSALSTMKLTTHLNVLSTGIEAGNALMSRVQWRKTWGWNSVPLRSVTPLPLGRCAREWSGVEWRPVRSHLVGGEGRDRNPTFLSWCPFSRELKNYECCTMWW